MNDGKELTPDNPDRNGVFGRCRCCGGQVHDYNCNAHLQEVRPEGAEWDWWIACENPSCEHHYGEGILQVEPEWLCRD